RRQHADRVHEETVATPRAYARKEKTNRQRPRASPASPSRTRCEPADISSAQKDDMMRDPLSSAHAKCVSTFQEREEVPAMAIVGGFDIHRRQVTFDYLDTVTGQVRRR